MSVISSRMIYLIAAVENKMDDANHAIKTKTTVWMQSLPAGQQQPRRHAY